MNSCGMPKQRKFLMILGILATLSLVTLHITYLRKYVIREENHPADCIPLRMSEDALPLTTLASYPGSGNTWLRHLIQQATGIYTGSIYCDLALRDNGFPGECFRNQSVVVVKTHIANISSERLTRFNAEVERGILLVRNPYDMIKARLNFKYGGHTGYAAAIPQDEWEIFVRKKTTRWKDFNMYWLQEFKKPLLIVKFEDMQRNLTETVKRVAQFLDFRVTDDILRCVRTNSEGNHHRKKLGVTDVSFTEEMQKGLDQVISDVNNESIKRMEAR